MKQKETHMCKVRTNTHSILFETNRKTNKSTETNRKTYRSTETNRKDKKQKEEKKQK